MASGESGTLKRRLARWAGVSAVLLAVAALAVIAAVPGAVGANHPAVIVIAAIGAAGIAAALMPVIQQRATAFFAGRDDLRRLLADECHGVRNGVLPRVGDVPEPLLMGVHPSVAAAHDRDDQVPEYVARVADRQLRLAVRLGGFVLVVGDSAAGKTRSAYEAIHAELGDYQLLIPRRAGSLPMLARSGFQFPGEVVIWLNDLERYLGDDGLDRLLLERLLRGGPRVVVLATLRQAVYGAYLHGESGSLTFGGFARPAREVLEAVGTLIQLG